MSSSYSSHVYIDLFVYLKNQSWTFKTSNICWRVRIINLSHWLFSINIPQAQAREHIRKTTPRPDMRTSGYGSMRTSGLWDKRTW